MPLNGYSMRPHDTQCRGPWPVPSDELGTCYYDQWVEPGQFRRVPGSPDRLALIIGACDEQDSHQHDRTIKWLVLVNDQLKTVHLSDIGEWWLVYPVPNTA